MKFIELIGVIFLICGSMFFLKLFEVRSCISFWWYVLAILLIFIGELLMLSVNNKK